jgi:hypothetical protein
MQYAVDRMQERTTIRPTAAVHPRSGADDLRVECVARAYVALSSDACTLAPSSGIPDATGVDGADSEVRR